VVIVRNVGNVMVNLNQEAKKMFDIIKDLGYFGFAYGILGLFIIILKIIGLL